MKTKSFKFALCLCLLLGCALPAFSQSAEQLNETDTSVNWELLDQSLLKLDENLRLLQVNNDDLQRTLNDAQSSLKIQREFLASQSLQLQTLESRLQKSESTIKKWKTFSLVTVGIAVPTITVLTIILLNR